MRHNGITDPLQIIVSKHDVVFGPAQVFQGITVQQEAGIHGLALATKDREQIMVVPSGVSSRREVINITTLEKFTESTSCTDSMLSRLWQELTGGTTQIAENAIPDVSIDSWAKTSACRLCDKSASSTTTVESVERNNNSRDEALSSLVQPYALDKVARLTSKVPLSIVSKCERE